MRIIAYTYEADTHCVPCTQFRFMPDTNTGTPHGDTGIPVEARDCEGNQPAPIFSTDEQPQPFFYCGDCHNPITP